MPRKGKRLKRLRAGQLIGSTTANELIDFFNAFMAAKIIDASSSDILISDLSILFKIKGGGTGGTAVDNYRGEYNPDGTLTQFNPGDYVFGDVVRVSPTNANATTMGGTVIPGVYICVQDGPATTDVPNHPLSPGGETAFWHWLATWPSVTSICNGDGTSQNVFADQQNSNA